MRRVLASTCGLAASMLIALAAGCTFLVPFEDAPAEAGVDDVRSPRPRDAGTLEPVDAGTGGDTTPPPPTGNCDPFPDIAEIQGCARIVENGQICGDSTPIKFPSGYDSAAYVVTCSKVNGAICVKECTGAGKCAHLPSGFPDVCDQCEGKEGHYCGRDMPGWPPANFGLLVECRNDRVAGIVVCDAGCTTSAVPGEAQCTPAK